MTPGHYRKRPVDVSAVHLTAVNRYEVAEWCGGEAMPAAPSGTIYAPGILRLDTVIGSAWAHDGDWIVCDPRRREFFPVKGSAFAEMYEAVS